MTVQGLDVSQWQGNFDWSAEKGKIGFGMAKATEGTTITDSEFVHNWNSMWGLSHTLPRFAYHFFHASEDPTAQAERLVALVKPHGLLAGDNLVLDLEATESNGTNDNVKPATVAARAQTFLHVANELAPDRRVLVYCNPAFAKAGNCAGLGAWSLWLASYGVSKPAVPSPWKTWTFWQKSDNGLDLDVFNGTKAELLSFTRMPASR